MILVYIQDTLKLLGEFPKPSRVGQTDRGAYIVYEFPSKEEQKELIVDIMETNEGNVFEGYREL
jgi:hypothetical protein